MKPDVDISLVEYENYTKVKYYTLRFCDENETEIDKFYDNYQEEYSESVYYIKMWIAEIGEKFSGESRYFRTEDNVEALPPPADEIRSLDIDIDSKKMKLRLYCIVLNPEAIILVNGGIKISNLTQGSQTCWNQYLFTSSIASQLKRLQRMGLFSVIGKNITTSRSFNLTYKK